MKKGFTLIELLAVIVILAIIAVIAVPIVLNIIDETKSNSILRSADFYLDAVEMSVAQSTLKNQNIPDGIYNILESGNICLKYTGTTCTEELVVEVNGEHPEEGTITLVNSIVKSVDVMLSEKRIVKNDKGEIIYFPCTLINGDKNTNGSKYECEVSPGVKYNFYVLSQETDGTTNLIMDRNMCDDGTPTDANKEDKCLVAWYADDLSNSYGPVTAMTYLYNATKSWINIPSLNYIYNDNEFHGDYDFGYASFVSNDGVATITSLDGTRTTTIGSKTEPLKARMPIYTFTSMNSSKNEVAVCNNNNVYLYENLDGGYWDCDEQPENNISGLYGYWTLSSGGDYNMASYTIYYGTMDFIEGVDYDGSYGVRPVINLKF